MLVFSGMTVSMWYSVLSRPMAEPSNKPRSRIRTFITPPPERFHKAVDPFIEEGAFMLVARDQACGHHQKEIQVAVDMDQRDDLVAPMPLVAFVAQIHGLGIDRMVMLVE